MSTPWTTADIPDQHGRVAVVTGANSGIGLEIARGLASAGARVVMAARNTTKGRKAADDVTAGAPGVDVTVEELDLASLASVRAFAQRMNDDYRAIDLLINDAGVMFVDRTITVDGFEQHLAVNHLSHFALTGLLLPRLLAAPGARVVTLTSGAYKMGAHIHFDDLSGARHYSPSGAYGQSKLANVLFTLGLDRRFASSGADAIAVASHPGASSTGIMHNTPWYLLPAASLFQIGAQSAAMGALPSLRAATDPQVRGSQLYGPSDRFESHGFPNVQAISKQALDQDLQDHLWQVSERLTGVEYHF